MSWVFLAIIATFFWAFGNILDKILRTKYLKSSIALTASFGIFGIFFSLILFLVIGIPSIPFQYLTAAVIGGVLTPYAVISYVKALSLEEASRVIPLWHLTPLFILALAVIFLNEILTALDYAAFAFILLGGIIISTRKIGTIFHLSPAVAFMLLSSSLFAISDVLMKFAFSTGNFWETYIPFNLGVSLSALSLFILPEVKKTVYKAFTFHKQKFASLIFLSVVLGFIGSVLWQSAIFSGPVTLVSVFVAFQSLFVLLIATFLSLKFPFLIKEAIGMKIIGMKLIAIVLMFLGLFLLSL